MAVYEYTAKDRSGQSFSATYKGVDNVAMLKEDLGKMGYVLEKASQVKDRGGKSKKIKQSEVAAFAYNFAGMYSAGLSVLKCLEILEEQTENRAFRYIVADIRQSVATGSSLKNAFGSYKNIFSDFFLGMLEAGETGGELAKVLEMSAAYLEKQDEIRRKVRSAFVYPIVVFVMCLVVVSCFLVFVIPVFSKMYGQLHVSLPGPTQFLMDASCFFMGWWWAILFVSGGAVIGLRRLLKKPHIRKKWDGFKLNMPVFGKLNRMVVVSNFTRAWAIMISAGVSLIEALNMASLVAHNYKMAQITEELQEAIKGGNQIAKSLKKCDIFPPMIMQLIASGEEAGKLAEMLNKGTDILDKEIERTIGSLLVKLEPALTVIMGVIVGFLLISMYLPMFDYMSHLK